jgi:enoyl-CoA hydratase
MNPEAEKQDLVTYRKDGHVGFITLNRPDKRNAMNLALWRALDTAIGKAEADADVRVVLLKGEGKSFCAGLDLSPDNELMPMITGQPSASQKIAFYQVVRQVQAIHTRLERLPKPTVALIQGHCLGAGLELVLCCDIRLCSTDAVFALPEARLAIITDVGGLQRLPKVVGPGHAREIAFRGHRFTADHAASIQLVNHVYPNTETLYEKAREMAGEIASNPPLAVLGAKQVFLFSQDLPMEQALDYTAARSSMIMPSEDIFEAFSSYMEKREGKFKGA